MSGRRYVYFWPDGCWVDRDDYRASDWNHKSDDFGLLVLPADADDSIVDRIVLGGAEGVLVSVNEV